MSESEHAVGVQVTHNCGHVLGTFGATEDHGQMDMLCPKCKRWVQIYQQLLSYPEDVEYNDDAEVKYQDVSEQFNVDGTFKG